MCVIWRGCDVTQSWSTCNHDQKIKDTHPGLFGSNPGKYIYLTITKHAEYTHGTLISNVKHNTNNMRSLQQIQATSNDQRLLEGVCVNNKRPRRLNWSVTHQGRESLSQWVRVHIYINTSTWKHASACEGMCCMRVHGCVRMWVYACGCQVPKRLKESKDKIGVNKKCIKSYANCGKPAYALVIRCSRSQ